MRRLFWSCAAPLVLLGACGDGVPFTGEARASYDICIENGGDAPYCTCVTKALQEKLSPEAFAAMSKRQQGADFEATLDEIATADAACKANSPS